MFYSAWPHAALHSIWHRISLGQSGWGIERNTVEDVLFKTAAYVGRRFNSCVFGMYDETVEVTDGGGVVLVGRLITGNRKSSRRRATEYGSCWLGWMPRCGWWILIGGISRKSHYNGTKNLKIEALFLARDKEYEISSNESIVIFSRSHIIWVA